MRLEVWWPSSGTRQEFRDLPMDRFVRIVEGAADYEVLELPCARLGGER